MLSLGIKNFPDKLERATWLNYIRGHDDIGLGFDDNDIRLAGYEPKPHRNFLVDYFTGNNQFSSARGVAFGINKKTGDARIAGSLASLVGLEAALESGDKAAIQASISTINLLHSIILSFGGVPLIYYGDSIGALNDKSYLADEYKKTDSRWVHRPNMNWEKAELRNNLGAVENQIFGALKKMIAVRKEVTAFADHNNRELLEVDNPHLFIFSRFDISNNSRALVICNFDANPQKFNMEGLRKRGFLQFDSVKDLYSEDSIALTGPYLEIPH